MATYSYWCKCGYEGEVIKSIHLHDSPESCPKCQSLMDRDFSKCRIYISNFKGHYNESLGRYIGSQGDIRDARNRIGDETGVKPIEIGNDSPKVAPPKHDVDMREVLAYAEKLQTDRGETVNAG